MQSSNSSPPSAPPDAATDSSPLLSNSFSDHLIRHTPPSLQTAARFFRRASGRSMMLREPSVQVRETAAEQLEERQSDWMSSKPVIILDIFWNMAFLAIGVTVLGLSVKENPCVPLRLWIVGYLLQGMFHFVCVIVEYKRRRIVSSSILGQNGTWGNGGVPNFSSGSDAEGSSTEQLQEYDGNSITKHIESTITKFSFIWWIIGFYWLSVGGQSLTQDSPQLYWLCITFLAFDIVILLICIAVTCLIGIAVCCCLPCILGILYFVADQEGATTEEIDQLPKYKFRRIDGYENDGNVMESSRGIITENDCDTPVQHFLSLQDAECCICLSTYEDGAELRELPCNHHFHCACVDKWLHLNATCPLCKFDILKTANHQV